ncbi:LTA synthase family protein [Solitalea lacus]|uniref:LTA synthase family protein n=1 Tax=Solitalea lacus TaxID=2911172 RepID=UPI001EDA873E|nr:LTA synthase family protein [Solitalea lacus]UKJ08546.1 LTA synthase family protein [Solitalea lacus]
MLKLFKRFTPVLILVLLIISISIVTRTVLIFHPSTDLALSTRTVLGIYGLGLLYDLSMASFASIPFVLYIWVYNEKVYSKPYIYVLFGALITLLGTLLFTNLFPADYNKLLYKAIVIYIALRLCFYLFLWKKGENFRIKWRRSILAIDFFIICWLLIFNGVSEWFFWNEFSTRYNFIAVDYLIYTNEVIGNIKESYPLPTLILGVTVVATAVFLLIRKPVINSVSSSSQPALQRHLIAVALLIWPVASFYLVKSDWRQFSSNAFANELAGNGLYQFGVAFNNNELDYNKFYKQLPAKEAFTILRKELSAPNAKFISNDVFNIERDITSDKPENKKNIVLISVESLSADFMKAFGNTQNITPNLDSLANHSLFFTNLYASGTRTVRGLEALSLGITPTPGQSVVKRPNNGNLFTIGSVLRSKGYITQYVYGGYSYFDNMKEFFGTNGYEVIDRSAIPLEKIHYENVWGVADEDLFSLALNVLDKNSAQKKPFFTHIMTVSNHRPFTYPDGRIDIPSSSQSREGGVKYTDYAIGTFIKQAQKHAWFKNTIFVIVADHCASSAGKTDLPVNKYHIPCLVYSPEYIQPRNENTLMAQIDIIPTILGFLNLDYRSKFFGKDIFQPGANHNCAFVSTYQSLGFIENDTLSILKPVRHSEQYIQNFTDGSIKKSVVHKEALKKTIAYYQCASWLLSNKKYNAM